MLGQLKRVTKANYAGLARLLLVIPIAFAIPLEQRALSLSLLVLAVVTDFLDGILARWEKTVCNFGIFLDLTADKLLVIVALVGLLEVGLVELWIVIVITFREILVLGGRCYAASEGKVIPAEFLGGAKILVTYFALLNVYLEIIPRHWGLRGAAALTVVSGLWYLWRMWPYFLQQLYYSGSK